MHEFLGKVSYTVADFLNAQITGHGEFWYLGRSNQSAELAGILIGLYEKLSADWCENEGRRVSVIAFTKDHGLWLERIARVMLTLTGSTGRSILIKPKPELVIK